MPRYRITDPQTGRTLLIEGDGEPTDQEADELFAQAPAAPAKKDPVPAAQEVVDRYANNMVKGLSYANPVMPSWITKPLMDKMGAQDVARSMLTKGGVIGDVAASVIPAIGGSIAGAPGGLPGVIVGGGIGAGAGNALKQAREILRGESEGFKAGELTGNVAAGAVPLGKLKAGADVVKVLGTRAIQGGAIGAASEGISSFIDEGKLDWGKMGVAGAMGTGMGLVLGVPEALILRKMFGGKVPLEGKTLAQGAETIAAEAGVPVQTILDKINDATGVSKAAGIPSAQEAAATFQKQVVAKSAQDSADSILAAEAMKQTREQQFLLAQSELALQDVKQAALTGAEYRAPGVPVNNAPKPAIKGPTLSGQASRMYDEYGGVNPAILLPVASAAMGGVIGGAQGDTAEERVQNALIGAGVAGVGAAGIGKLVNMVRSTKVAPQVAEAAQGVMNNLRKKISPQSILPDEVRKELRYGEQAATAIRAHGVTLAKDLDQVIGSTGNVATQGITARSVQDYLTTKGASPASLPAPVRVAAEKIRNFIDDLSDRAVTEGVVIGELANTFTQNKGAYLRRSYEAFLNDNFQFDPKKIDAAVAAVASHGKMSTQEAGSIVAGIMNKADVENVGNFMVGASKIGGKDVSSLIKRENLLQEVRSLLGEIHDPVINTGETISRLAKLIENHAAQVKVRDIGQKVGIFSQKVDPHTFSTPVVSPSSGPHSVLTGLYATPEIAGAFNKEVTSGRTAAVPGAIWKTLTTATSLAKASKTVWNPYSYAPNLIGGIVTNVANGNFRVGAAGKGLMLGLEEMGALRAAFPKYAGREALQAELMELRKSGVLGESVGAGDLLASLDASFWRRLSDPAAKTISIPGKVYGGIDDFTRYAGYKSEVARYTKALPGASTEQIKALAGDTVRATMPTYSAIPKVVRDLSVSGLVPQFIAFRYETFRNTYNTLKIGYRDLKTGIQTNNPALRNEGAKRLASMTAVLGAASGLGISKLSKEQNGVTDEQDRAVRYYAAPWDRDGIYKWGSGAGGGKPVSFSNMSYLLPQALPFEAIEAAKQGKDFGDMANLFVSDFGRQFIGNPLKDSIVLSAATGALTGRDPTTGREIPKTDVEPTTSDRISYVAEKAFKPLAIDFVEQTQKALRHEQGDYGKVFTMDEQRNRLMGLRQTTLDPIQAVKWRTKDFADQINGAAEIYRTRQGRNLTPAQNDEFYKTAEDARHRVFKELQVAREHALNLGVTADQFTEAMRAAKITPILITGINDGGEYTPMSRDKNEPAHAIAEALRGKSGEQVRQELARIHLEEGASRTKSVISEYRSMVRDDARGVTSREEVMRSIPAEDRADYINRRLEKLQTTEERQQYIRELSARGVITPEVRLRMMGRN